jgi:hypothetical protein
MPGLVKVGFTMKDPDERARELAHTGNPHPYTVDYQVWVEDPYSVEQQAHRKLTGSGYRVGEDRFSGSGIEWFSCKIEQAIVAIRHATGGEYAHETFRRAEREIVEANFRKENARKRAIEQVAQLTARLEKEFKTAIAVAFPPRPYWQYFLGCYVSSVIILAVFFSKMTGSQVFFSSFLFGGIAAFFLQVMREDSHLKSSSYLAMKAKLEKDLEAAKWHSFSCPHCKVSIKIDYVESFAEGTRIKFHCKSCDKDVPNPLANDPTAPAIEVNDATGKQVALSPETKKLIKSRLEKLPPEKRLPALKLAFALAKKTRDKNASSVSVEQEIEKPHQKSANELLNQMSPEARGVAMELGQRALERIRQTKARHDAETIREKDVPSVNVGHEITTPDHKSSRSPEEHKPLRHLFVEVWSSDNGHATMREDLWDSFLAELDCELTENAIQPDDNRVRINQACDEIWENRREEYRKSLWRELDDAIAAALPKERWGGR